ncbi:MAG TPA: sigma-70 family RNA polymerase sigma factor [Opitutaceae bacterium]|jgi:RNA polymerase sigma factor (sigma-70 family)
MKTDRDLLQSYASGGSEDAFAEIVRRHVNLVYSLAFRQLRGNASLAADATQAVFTSLAAKAATLPHLSNLSSWLYTTTRYTVSHTVRTERRRQERETKAYAMNEATPSDPGCPEMPVELIDAALDSLDDEDREAVLLRFVEGHAFSGVGLALGVSEDAARMRANRALEKIRAFFARQGITSTTAAFAAALTGEGLAAPAGLAGGVCTTAFAKAAGDSGGFLASLSAAKVAAVVSSVVAVAAVACALRPAALVPAAQETNSQPLAALLSNKAASAMTLSPASPPPRASTRTRKRSWLFFTRN